MSAPMLRMSGSTASRRSSAYAVATDSPSCPRLRYEPADHLGLAEEDDETFLDIARQPREVVHLEKLIGAQRIRRARS